MSTVSDCAMLIERYLAGDLGAWEFSITYLRTFQRLPIVGGDLFQVLESVWSVAEGYDPSVTSETATVHDFTEEQLRATCEDAMTRLRAMDLDPGDDDLPEPVQQPRGR